MNWNPSTIFDARGRQLWNHHGAIGRLNLYSDGWALYDTQTKQYVWQGWDVWGACHFLNRHEAEIAKE